MNFIGLIIAIATFLIIGFFHPIVIKSEYHFGTRCWWVFALFGILFIGASLFVESPLFSPVLGVIGCSCLWSILEIFEQKKRVEKGWFPMNPKRKGEYKPRHTAVILFPLLFLLTSCNGILGDIYDKIPEEEDFEMGIDDSGDLLHIVNLNTTDYGAWIYLDLHTGQFTDTIQMPTTLTGKWDGRSGIGYKHGLNDWMSDIRFVQTDPQPDAEHWDIAIHHFDVKTNGCAAYETEYSSLDQLPPSSEAFRDATFTEDEWTEHQVLYDLSGMLNYDIGYQQSMVNMVLSRWVTMDFATPPPIYSFSDRVYIIRLKDGTYAALKLINYMKPSGAKGYMTFDVIYPY